MPPFGAHRHRRSADGRVQARPVRGHQPHEQVRLRATRGKRQPHHGLHLPRRPDRCRPLRDPQHSRFHTVFTPSRRCPTADNLQRSKGPTAIRTASIGRFGPVPFLGGLSSKLTRCFRQSSTAQPTSVRQSRSGPYESPLWAKSSGTF